jgi:hypothetical protein
MNPVQTIVAMMLLKMKNRQILSVIPAAKEYYG